MWEKRSPRQAYLLALTLKSMSEDINKSYKKSKNKKETKLPNWYKVPDGDISVFHADDVKNEDI